MKPRLWPQIEFFSFRGQESWCLLWFSNNLSRGVGVPRPWSAELYRDMMLENYGNLAFSGEDNCLPESLIYPRDFGSFTCRMSPGIICVLQWSLRSLLLRNKWELVRIDRKLPDDSHDSNLPLSWALCLLRSRLEVTLSVYWYKIMLPSS